MNLFNSQSNKALNACFEAAKKLIDLVNLNHHPTINYKQDRSLVLDIDIILQEVILNSLNNETIVSEELLSSHELVGQEKDYFIIDPIDGTTSCRRFLTAQESQVGFGPMIGFIRNGKLESVAFFNCPQRSIFFAEINHGAYKIPFDQFQNFKVNSNLYRLAVPDTPPLKECAVLFFAGLNGELKSIEKLKSSGLVENFYRFGGFANDVSRLALGSEQIQIQYSVKAWDFSAVLLAHEVGLDILVDPSDANSKFTDWKIREENPVLISPKLYSNQIYNILS